MSTAPVTPPAWHDPEARCWLLTGDDWAPWLEWQIRRAQSSVYLSIYMISHHWRDPSTGKLDLTRTLAEAGARGLQCRGIVDQPNVQGRKEPYNIKAARELEAAGWIMRKVPDRRTLHEKIIIIDRRLCFVGSHNISKASATTNYDCTLAMDSAMAAAVLERHWWDIWRIAVPLDQIA